MPSKELITFYSAEIVALLPIVDRLTKENSHNAEAYRARLTDLWTKQDRLTQVSSDYFMAIKDVCRPVN